MKPLSVLIVDDDDVDRENLRRLLAKVSRPIDMHEAASFAEAKAQLQTSKFDCVFIDYSLGDATGFDVISEVRQHRAEICPIIMISTNGNEKLVVEAMREGVYDYITKTALSKEQLQHSIDGSLHWVERETELRESRIKIEYLALHDALTGLPNRVLLFDRLDQEIRSSERSQRSFSLLMMDLNNFKEINDSLGHDAGDAVLREVALRLTSTVRDLDTVARLGGDEFACILPWVESLETGQHIAEKIVKALHAPIFIGHEAVAVSISIGIAQFPIHGATSRVLLKRADQAMYQAKQGAKGIQIYSPHAFVAVETPSGLFAGRIKHAVENGEILLHFQPQVSLDTCQIIGKEALVRWQHPEYGLLYPDRFISIAEKNPVIAPLTLAVLQIALDEEQKWRASGLCVPISVNLSARVLDDESLPARIMQMLSEHGLPPSCLVLELTETAISSAPVQACSILRAMSEAGLRISIDDFGSGYTSFKQLHELEIAEIKIDGLYVKNITAKGKDSSIVRSVVELGRGFDIQVVAECVERRESWQLLRDLGCRCAQGYSIGAPMAHAEFDHWIDQWPRIPPKPGEVRTRQGIPPGLQMDA
ncbi:MAG: EAL domain-containing protein [Terracidiphilus sp.]|jgi:diguanylate cyclase (GGDEF)-like protein